MKAGTLTLKGDGSAFENTAADDLSVLEIEQEIHDSARTGNKLHLHVR